MKRIKNMTIKEKLQNITITAEQEKILEIAVENQKMVFHALNRCNTQEAQYWKNKVIEDVQILEALNNLINWMDIVYDEARKDE